MKPRIDLESYRAQVGQEVGVSDWVLVDQPMIDGFAAISGDHQFVHVDPVAAAATPFGGTIAHGFLTLSLISGMIYSAVSLVEGTIFGLNYGLDKVRFLRPVPSGRRVRGRFTLADVRERAPGQWQSTFVVAVEIEGEEKPALVAEWLMLIQVDD
jgi:acyl dehydratase